MADSGANLLDWKSCMWKESFSKDTLVTQETQTDKSSENQIYRESVEFR